MNAPAQHREPVGLDQALGEDAACATAARLPDAGAMAEALAHQGHALIPGLLDCAACKALAELYDQPQWFRSRVIMERHGFGRGQYQYFDRPLPPLIAMLRTQGYQRLVATANAWHRALAIDDLFDAEYDHFLARCRAAGQDRPTPLLLRYGPGDENRLHQDLYGEHVFPLQIAVLLSRPGQDFAGGEFVLTEQRPRQQSRVHVAALGQGDAIVFPVRFRPIRGARGYYRAVVRHGVSEVRRGQRHVLGIIFHDAA